MRSMGIIAFATLGCVGGVQGQTPYAAGARAEGRSVQYKRGKSLFAQCRACHQLKAGAEPNVGPNLAGMFGRKAGSAPGFSYSAALGAANFSWDTQSLDRWLAKPNTLVPGNVMAFAGIPDPENRAVLIAYLRAETTDTK